VEKKIIEKIHLKCGGGSISEGGTGGDCIVLIEGKWRQNNSFIQGSHTADI